MLKRKQCRHIFTILYSFFIYNGITAQLSLTSTGVDFVINFDHTTLNVNEGIFAGDGFHPEPITGQLDSDAWALEGLSVGDLSFGGIGINVDFARGSSIGGETIGGIYSFEVALNNMALGFQATGSDFTPGNITLKINNSSGFTLERLKFGYTLWELNDQDRANDIELAYSTDNVNYSNITGSIFTSAAPKDPLPIWQSTIFEFDIENLSVLPNEFIFIRWSTNDATGGGSRDELAIDDISFRISNSLCVSEAFYLDGLGILQSTEGLTLSGIADSYETPGNFGEASPSSRFDVDGVFIETPDLVNPYSMQFWAKGQGNTSGSSFRIEGFNGLVWSTIDLIDPLPSTGTIFQYQNLSVYEKFRFTYNKTLGNLAFDDLKIFCGDCTAAIEPINAPSNPGISENLCNRASINWSGGDAEYSLVIISNSGSIDFIPEDNTSYVNNLFYAQGQEVFADEYVAYAGSGTSITLAGIDISTTYHIAVFGYNGLACEENYLTSSYATFNFTTPDCNQCPYLTSALINPCTGEGLCNGNEGYNEMLFMNSGGIDINTISPSFLINYISGNSKLLNENIVANSTTINILNALAGCTSIFIDGSNTIIPAGSKIVFVNEQLCTEDIDFGGLCNGETIYVIFSNSSQWSSSGVLANSGQEDRRFELDFRTAETGCLLDYSYVPNNIPQIDGAVVSFGQNGGLPTSYQSLQNCELLFDLLPVTLGEFYAYKEGNGIHLFWKTYSEVGNAGFVIERKNNEEDILIIGWVDGNGTTPFSNNYSFIDNNPEPGLNYYRLKQTDWDGNFEYSEWIVVNFPINSLKIYINSVNNLEIRSTEKNIQVELTLYNTNGLKIKSYNALLDGEGKSTITLPILAKWIYLVRYKSKDQLKVVKFVY